MIPDPTAMRQALGCFATGVTVVTARDASQQPVAMTVSSFTGVSLEPPLVLWCAQRGVAPIADFLAAQSFAIHVLHAGQQDLAMHFARDVADKFSGVDWQAGAEDLPLLKGCAACFQCRSERHVDGGDHVVLFGRVVALDHHDVEPLVFHRGQLGGFAG
ncbi:flavin reductase family protein [Wenzhouxiangella sp. AB-CW3]|uniref:flavin reductase family protein n=1 Tax=Wenzhouxiangella sp. AB-CW3 TaxID=2771012 RepID=UPI00168BD581|nr:flavin reductase family protein [Wenzhouxiangella sp. AB-CW3]QOC21388.1 flavin reductase family protein [Wenzhouxiangella sp. AB-CW3]